MAYRAIFYVLRDEDLQNIQGRTAFRDQAEPVGSCSHFMAHNSEIRELLDGGRPISALTHPLVQPHYRLSSELPAVLEELKEIMARKEFGDNFSPV